MGDRSYGSDPTLEPKSQELERLRAGLLIEARVETRQKCGTHARKLSSFKPYVGRSDWRREVNKDQTHYKHCYPEANSYHGGSVVLDVYPECNRHGDTPYK